MDERKNGRTEGKINGRTDRRKDIWMDGRKEGRIKGKEGRRKD